MIEYAAKIYDPVYPEDADVKDLTDRRNSLNRFISYHLLDRLANYNDLTVDGELFKNNFKHKLWDVAEWYETMMPHSIMNISHPTVGDKGTGDLGIFINRRGVGRKPDNRGVFIPGARIIPPSEANADQSALNGVYHYIDDIIHYGQQTQEEVLNERMRID
ncbi:MAG: fasciclin domain-containing protein, partial [Bacteroidaceae bacterium]|nr:fasciclin domain-containing protein [Bacteroidaceae bacterium]